MGVLNKLFNRKNNKSAKDIKRYFSVAQEVNSLEKDFEKLSDIEIKNKTKELKARLEKGETLNDVLVEGFALVREASKRTLKQRHFDTQIIGGAILSEGKIAEMKTGEGKTLSSTMAVYLNALTGKGVHVVTVNDYLARRDAVWMGQIYDFLGLSIGCLNQSQAFVYDANYKKPNNEQEKVRDELGGFQVVEDFLKPSSKKEAYLADITYSTNNELGFDYLRDNMAPSKEMKAQRGFYFAIVDEIDSILIDEARTPLIISQPDVESSQYYKDFARIIPRLKQTDDFEVDEKAKAATLTENGIEKIEGILGLTNIYEDKGMKYLHYLEEALKARVFFQKDRDYIVKDGKVIIIDEFTGRLMPSRRYSGGLHQAIEAKEGVQVQAESKTLASITFQNFFRFYEKLSGMTGTALTSSEEFYKVYGLEVVSVPTNKPVIRKDLSDKVYKTERGKYKAIVREVKEKNKLGQPILIGTRSVERNEYLSKLLAREGIKHEVLNAKNHLREGQIIAQAGKKAAVTVATNMAGRGVDIILGGNPSTEQESNEIKKLGGLHVIGTERHEARRIDNQLRGRAGRQGDEGSSQFFVSLEDDLMRIFGSDKIKMLMDMMKIPEDEPIEAKMLSGAIEKAQEKVEGMYFDIRKRVLEYDEVIAKHRHRIFTLRDDILEKDFDGLKAIVLDFLQKEIESILRRNKSDFGLEVESIINEIKMIMPLSEDCLTKIKELSGDEITDYFFQEAEQNLTNKINLEGKDNSEKLFRYVCLRVIDNFWTDHLDALEHLKDSVSLRAYGGKDPIIEYKTEGHKMFQNLLADITGQISRTIFKLSVK